MADCSVSCTQFDGKEERCANGGVNDGTDHSCFIKYLRDHMDFSSRSAGRVGWEVRIVSIFLFCGRREGFEVRDFCGGKTWTPVLASLRAARVIPI